MTRAQDEPGPRPQRCWVVLAGVVASAGPLGNSAKGDLAVGAVVPGSRYGHRRHDAAEVR
jgi:hypothetical protein